MNKLRCVESDQYRNKSKIYSNHIKIVIYKYMRVTGSLFSDLLNCDQLSLESESNAPVEP